MTRSLSYYDNDVTITKKSTRRLACYQLKTNHWSADNFKKARNRDGSTPGPRYGHLILVSGYQLAAACICNVGLQAPTCAGKCETSRGLPCGRMG